MSNNLDLVNELISDGEKMYSWAKAEDIQTGEEIVRGLEYCEWLYKTRMYLENNHQGESFTQDFIQISREANGESVRKYEQMMGILKSVKYAFEKGIYIDDADYYVEFKN